MAFINGNSDQLAVARIVEVPIEVVDKQAILSWFAGIMAFPEYFGGNWDALCDMIKDLSWLPEGPLALVPRDIPFRKDMELQREYLSILKDVHGHWSRSPFQKLMVVFPEDAEEGAGR